MWQTHYDSVVELKSLSEKMKVADEEEKAFGEALKNVSIDINSTKTQMMKIASSLKTAPKIKI